MRLIAMALLSGLLLTGCGYDVSQLNYGEAAFTAAQLNRTTVPRQPRGYMVQNTGNFSYITPLY